METVALFNHAPFSWFRNFRRSEKRIVQPIAELAIEGIREAHVASLNAGDLDLWTSLFAPDAVQMPPHSPINKGQNSIRAWGQKLLGCLQMSVSLSPDDFRASGELAFESGTYDSTMTVRQTGEVLTDHGKYVMVYRRQAPDHWSIAQDIWNSDKPNFAFRGTRA
jgi:ketosteroid isomerase-like protein